MVDVRLHRRGFRQVPVQRQLPDMNAGKANIQFLQNERLILFHLAAFSSRPS